MYNLRRIVSLPLVALVLLAAAYVFIRAWLIPFSWDESFSWIAFVRGDDWWPEVNSEMAANNHLLNTWLMRLSELFFGSSEFALRLPNLLFSLVYFITAYFFALREKKWYLQIAVFCVLVCHPYLLDFFGIARGYGISHGLLLIGLWLLWKWCINNKLSYAVAALVIFSLGCFANLTQLHILTGASAVVVVRFLMLPFDRQWEGRFIRVQLLLLPLVLTLAALVPYSMRLKEAGALFFGLRGSWFQGTWRSLIDRMLFGITFPPFLKDVLAVFLIGIALTGIVMSVVYLLRKIKRKQLSVEQEFLLLLGGIALMALFGPLLQYNLLGTKLLHERTALFYIPLLMVLLVQLLRVFEKPKLTNSFYGFTVLPLVLLALFVSNISYQRDWPNERDIYEVVKSVNQKIGNKPSALGVDRQFSTDLEYAQGTEQLVPNITVTDAKSDDLIFDYLYLFPVQVDSFPEYEIIQKFSRSNTVLLKRKPFKAYQQAQICFEEFLPPYPKARIKKINDGSGKNGVNYVLSAGSDNPYPWEFKYAVPDSLQGKNFRIHFQLDAKQDEKRKGCVMYTKLKRDAEEIEFGAARFDHILYQTQEFTHVNSIIPLRNSLQVNDTIHVLLSTPSKGEILIDNVSVSIETFSGR